MKSHISRGFCTTSISPKPFGFLSPFRPGGGGTRKSQFRSKNRENGWKFCHFTQFPPISTHWHPFCLQAGSVAPRLANPTKTQRKINTFAAAWGAQFAQKRGNGAFPWNSVVYGKNNHFSAKVWLLVLFPASDPNGGPNPLLNLWFSWCFRPGAAKSPKSIKLPKISLIYWN